MTIAPDDPSVWSRRGQLVEALRAYQRLGAAPADDRLRLADWLAIPPEAELPLAEIAHLAAVGRDMVLGRLGEIRNELEELGALIRRNREVAAQLAEQVANGQRQMHETLRSFEAARRIILKQGNRLLADLGAEGVDQALAAHLQTIRASRTTAGLAHAILDWQRQGIDLFDKASLRASQLEELIETVYTRFQETPDAAGLRPPPLNLERSRAELLALREQTEAFCRSPVNLITTKPSLLKRFDAGPMAELHRVFAQGQRDAELWLKGVLTPLLVQIREAQARLEKRAGDEGKIRDYLHTLEARVQELKALRAGLLQRQAGLERIRSALQSAV